MGVHGILGRTCVKWLILARFGAEIAAECMEIIREAGSGHPLKLFHVEHIDSFEFMGIFTT